MATDRFEADRILTWLRELLESADAVDVHIVIEDAGANSSVVQITISNLPAQLAGLALAKSPPLPSEPHWREFSLDGGSPP